MERLTVREKCGVKWIVRHKECKEQFCRYRNCQDCEKEHEMLDKLYDLENLIDNEKLLNIDDVQRIIVKKIINDLLYGDYSKISKEKNQVSIVCDIVAFLKEKYGINWG